VKESTNRARCFSRSTIKTCLETDCCVGGESPVVLIRLGYVLLMVGNYNFQFSRKKLTHKNFLTKLKNFRKTLNPATQVAKATVAESQLIARLQPQSSHTLCGSVSVLSKVWNDTERAALTRVGTTETQYW